MYVIRLLFVLAYTTSVLAAPSYCTRIDPALAILRGPLRAIAVQFCQSYLGVRTATTTSFVTVTGNGNIVTTTLPGEIVTQTTQNGVTDTERQVNTITEAAPTVTVTSTITAGTRTIYQKKRDATAQRRAVPVPSQLRTLAASRISSACSCIATPSTTTQVVVSTTTAAGADVTETQRGQTITTVTTVEQRTTITVFETTTVGAAGTQTDVRLTTVTPILVKPKICNARGLPGANAFNYDANFNTNQGACIASCKTDNRCLSTGFYIVTDPGSGTQTGTCRKYDKSVTDSADLGFGYYNFNDKAC